MPQLLQNALFGTVLILAAAALRRALGDRLPPEVRLALWAVCLFCLFTPVMPISALSLWGLWRLMEPAPAQSVSAVPAPPALPAPDALPSIPRETGAGLPFGAALAAAWLIVALALAARYALLWSRTRRAVRSAALLSRTDPRYAPLPKCACLREGPMDGAPLTFGAVRPTVVLPPGLSGNALDFVLAHEGVHACRRDNLWHYAMALAQVVFWWNPAVWLMARLLRRDVELSCDRAVLRRLGPEQRREYAMTLVSLSTQVQARGFAFCRSFGRKAAEERIMMIMKYKKMTALGLILSVLLVSGVTVAFATGPVNSKPPVTPAMEDFMPAEGGGLEYSARGEHIEANVSMAISDSDPYEYSPAGEYTIRSKDVSEDASDARNANISTDFTVNVGQSFVRTVNTRNFLSDPHTAIKIKITGTSGRYRLMISGGSYYNYIGPVETGATEFTVYDTKDGVDYTIYVMNESLTTLTGHITISSYYD